MRPRPRPARTKPGFACGSGRSLAPESLNFSVEESDDFWIPLAACTRAEDGQRLLRCLTRAVGPVIHQGVEGVADGDDPRQAGNVRGAERTRATSSIRSTGLVM